MFREPKAPLQETRVRHLQKIQLVKRVPTMFLRLGLLPIPLFIQKFFVRRTILGPLALMYNAMVVNELQGI